MRPDDVVMRLAALLLILAACSNSAPNPGKEEDAGRRRRVLGPLPERVRAMPPHEIHDDGVGPYLLGMPLERILGLLPHSPRVELFQLDIAGDYSLVRTEDQKVTIGVKRREGVTFITVVDKDIARTEHGFGVGTDTVKLAETLGAIGGGRGQLSDSRLLRFAVLPGVSFVESKGRVEAVVVSRPLEATRPSVGEPKCDAGALADRRAEVLSAAQVPGHTHVAFGCLEVGRNDAVVAGSGRVQVWTADGDKLRRVWQTNMANLAFAGMIEVDGDEQDELVFVREDSSALEKAISVGVYRLENSRLIPLVDESVYKLSARAAGWSGVSLEDVHFLVELVSRDGFVEVTGVYLQRGHEGVREVVPLRRRTLLVRNRRVLAPPTRPAFDAGTP